jgi:hypothetical protein
MLDYCIFLTGISSIVALFLMSIILYNLERRKDNFRVHSSSTNYSGKQLHSGYYGHHGRHWRRPLLVQPVLVGNYPTSQCELIPNATVDDCNENIAVHYRKDGSSAYTCCDNSGNCGQCANALKCCNQSFKCARGKDSVLLDCTDSKNPGTDSELIYRN